MMFSNLIIVQGAADRMGVKMSHKYVFRVAKSFVVFFLFLLKAPKVSALEQTSKPARRGPWRACVDQDA